MRSLHIDLETYSSVELTKSGVYKYAEAPDFQIMLCAISIDGAPVYVLDLLTNKEHVEYFNTTLRQMLISHDHIKLAYNAGFEAACLARHFGITGEDYNRFITTFRCTMLHGLYCGYTAGLGATGAALGLPQERQKLKTGKDLIRYFCVPCKPTKTNGNRARNLPHHHPERWELFKEYCRQDVVTEMEIENRLRNFPVPDGVHTEWVSDQLMNARGVAVDLELMDGALSCGETIRARLMDEAMRISGLPNPNSRDQLKKWLEEETEEEITDLRKNTVSELLSKGISSDAATRMLEIRQELSKTSTKKYNALETAVCADGRVRGLLQFYGANRTGRWAGRIVQPQNLPRTYLEPLPLARRLVKARQLDALRVVYGSIPDTLSQLIRTAFISAPGYTLIDADFASIEARVVAWLAGEEWVLEVFRTHGKIYETTASQMFSVPLEKIKKGNPEYSYRQKGKVAVLSLGYQGGPAALINQGALNMGLTEDELPDVVQRWRRSNPRIADLWYALETAALEAVNTGRPVGVRGLVFARECDPANGLDFMTITLPSGRKLYYAKPHIGKNRWDRDSLYYYGMNQTTKKWEIVDTYGGKLTENCVQAIARDCLAEALRHLESTGYHVVFHVHDEVVIEAAKNTADLDAVVELMSRPIPWAPGLPMAADGWVNEFYKKD